MEKGFRTLASATAITLGLAAGGFAIPATADVPESTDPIKIALFDWTSVNVNANIVFSRSES